MLGKSSAVPAQYGVGRHHVKTSPPIGPESAQHNPQQPVATVEAQATRRVVLKNRKLVTKRQDLRLQSVTGSKSGDYQSENSDEKRAHRGNRHDLTNDRNLCVFRWDEFSVTTGIEIDKIQLNDRRITWYRLSHVVFTETRKEASRYAEDFIGNHVRTTSGIEIAEQLDLFSEPTESSEKLECPATS